MKLHRKDATGAPSNRKGVRIVLLLLLISLISIAQSASAQEKTMYLFDKNGKAAAKIVTENGSKTLIMANGEQYELFKYPSRNSLGEADDADILSASLLDLEDAKSGSTDEEIISDLALKFMVALFTSNDKLAKSICNQKGYETYQALSGVVTLGTLGANTQLDETAILADVDVVEVKKIGKTKAVAKLLCTHGGDFKSLNVPVEKNSKGEWKVAVTKQTLN